MWGFVRPWGQEVVDDRGADESSLGRLLYSTLKDEREFHYVRNMGPYLVALGNVRF